MCMFDNQGQFSQFPIRGVSRCVIELWSCWRFSIDGAAVLPIVKNLMFAFGGALLSHVVWFRGDVAVLGL